MGIKLLIKSLFLLLMLCIINGCDNSATNFNTSEKYQSQKNAERSNPGKPAAPVQLDYQYLGEQQTGVAVSISLTITPVVDAAMIRVDLNASEGLFIVDNLSELEFSNIAAGKPVTRTIQVIPQSDGKHHLRINLYIEPTSGRFGTRSFLIPLTTGMIEDKSELPNAVKIQPTENGEKLIIQKGAETRSVNP